MASYGVASSRQRPAQSVANLVLWGKPLFCAVDRRIMVAAGIQRAMVTVRNSKGLHMRPLEMIARKAQSFRSQVYVSRGNNRVDAKSLLHLLTLGAEPGVELEIDATGDDANEAVEQLVMLIGSEFEIVDHS